MNTTATIVTALPQYGLVAFYLVLLAVAIGGAARLLRRGRSAANVMLGIGAVLLGVSALPGRVTWLALGPDGVTRNEGPGLEQALIWALYVSEALFVVGLLLVVVALITLGTQVGSEEKMPNKSEMATPRKPSD